MIKLVKNFIVTVAFLSSMLSAQEAERSVEPKKVLALNYRGVVYNPKWGRLPGCLYKFSRNHSDDKRNLFLSGWVGLKVAYSKNFIPSIKDVIEGVEKDKDYYDIDGVEQYSDELYECLQGELEYVDPEMEDLLKRLSQNEVKLVLASNMHQDQYEENVACLKPELFNQFDIHHIGNQENGRKPSTQFFERLRKKIDKDFCDDKEECIKALEILHVDTKQEHIDGANKANVNIDSYRFTGNIKELENELCRRGFLPDEECKKEDK